MQLQLYYMKLPNKFSHLTAIERTHLSYPARFLLNNNLLKGKILDFGCGFGNDVKLLREKGFDSTEYDPYYFPQYPQDKFDTIICFYVLNVLFPEQQTNVLMEVAHLLKPGGKAYYAVRRDINKEGFREHYIYKQPTYQCIVKLPFNSIKLDDYCEIYEYTHYNYRTKTANSCKFCNPPKDIYLITESATAYAILNSHSQSKVNVLVIPKRHVSNYVQLSLKEQYACWLIVKKVKELFSKEFKSDDFDVKIINQNWSQNMNHAAIHVIPCYQNQAVSVQSKC